MALVDDDILFDIPPLLAELDRRKKSEEPDYIQGRI